MSIYYYLICPETKKRVWFGRNTRSVHEQTGALLQVTPYTSSEPIGPFLMEHQDKPIMFVSEFWFEDNPGEWIEVGWQDYRG